MNTINLLNYSNINNTKAIGQRRAQNSVFCNKLNQATPSFQALPAKLHLNIKRTTIIPPKKFLAEDVENSYDPVYKFGTKAEYKYIDEKASEYSYAKIYSNLNPKVLEIVDMPVISTVIANGVYPHGTISISSKLNDCLATDKLHSCAGVAIVDKKHNLQTLIHVCPGAQKKENKELIDYILSFSKPEDLEICIVPGDDDATDLTIDFIIKTIKNNNEKYKINFANFPDYKNDALFLKDGKLMCTEHKNIHAIEINPKDKISFASYELRKK